VIPDLKFGQRYYVKVSAINSHGIGASVISSIPTKMEITRPSYVDNVTYSVSHINNHNLEINWIRPLQSRWGGSFVRGYALYAKGNSKEYYNGSLHQNDWQLMHSDTMYLGDNANINYYNNSNLFPQKYQVQNLYAGVEYQFCALTLSGEPLYKMDVSECKPSTSVYTPTRIPSAPSAPTIHENTVSCSELTDTIDIERCRTIRFETPPSDGGKLIYEYRLYADVARNEMQSYSILLTSAETGTPGQMKITLHGYGTTGCIGYDANAATVITAFDSIGATVEARDAISGQSINGNFLYFMNIVFTGISGDVPLISIEFGDSECTSMNPTYSYKVEERRKGLKMDGTYNLHSIISSNFTS
jgi:hypothetical protein